MAIKLSNVVDSEGVTSIGYFNIILFTLIGVMGIFMGIFFAPQFLLKSKQLPLIINVIALFFGIASLSFLYWYTGRVRNG